MSEVLWTLPVPSTALSRGTRFTELGKRQCTLSFETEDDDATGEIRWQLLFDGVEAYRCTYLTSCTVEMFNTTYDKLVKLGPTPWLHDVLEVFSRSNAAPPELQHLMITFDDGPCYEFICTSFLPSFAAA